MIIYKQTLMFHKRIKIPKAIRLHLDLNEHNTCYWYVYVEENIVKSAVSINQTVNLNNVIYFTKTAFTKKTCVLTFPTDIVEILDLENQSIHWKVMDNKHCILFKPSKIVIYSDAIVNEVLSHQVTLYNDKTHSITIPRHIHGVKDFEDENKVFCCLYKHETHNIFLLNNSDDRVISPDYKLSIIFLAHIVSYKGDKHLVLDDSLRSFLKLNHDEEISWSSFYHNEQIFIGFERTFHYFHHHSFKDEIYRQNEDFYIRLPDYVLEALKIPNDENLLWKRFKHGDVCKINITIDKPRFYKNRPTGKIVEKVSMNGAVIPIPKSIVNHFKINKDTKIDWDINTSNKRYRFVEVIFS